MTTASDLSPSTNTLPEDFSAQEAQAAQLATTAEAQAENLKNLAALSSDASPQQQAEHIRGMVAISLMHLSANASAAARAYAERWQAWALGLASQLEQPAGA